MIKILLIPFFLLCSNISYAQKSSLTQTGDWLQLALPLTALGAGLIFDGDRSKDELYYKDFAKSFAAGLVLVHGLKYSMEKTRPDGSNNKSFPSAHTYAAFSGAAYINSRFGLKYGVPAYMLAGVVGYSRIKANSHYLDDVLAGASIAVLLNTYFAGRKNPNATFYIGHNGENPTINLSANFNEQNIVRKKKSKYRFSLFFGPTFLKESEFSFKNEDLLDLKKLKLEESYQHTANIGLDVNFNKYGNLSLNLQPYEINIADALYKDVEIGGKLFSTNENVAINWQQYDFDSVYDFALNKNKKIDLRAGLGIYANHSNIEIDSVQSSTVFKSTKFIVVPYAHLSAGSEIFNRLYSTLKLSFFDDGSTQYYKGRLVFDYQLEKSWTASIVYHYFFRQIEMFEKLNGDTTNESFYRQINFGVRYSF